jgi:hypothetical protein
MITGVGSKSKSVKKRSSQVNFRIRPAESSTVISCARRRLAGS